MFKRFKIVFLGILAIFLVSSISWAKPAPPKELIEILHELSEFEETYEAGKWGKANASIAEIEEMLKSMSGYLKKNSGSEQVSEFSANLKRLNSAVSSRNEDAVEEEYLDLQKTLFVIMDDYGYKVHPVFATMKQYVTDEAQEAAAKGDFKDVESEMKELWHLSKNAMFLFSKQRISSNKIDKFNAAIILVMKVSKKRKMEETKAALNELIERYEALGLK